MKQMTLYIDTERCMGCRACETACKLENDLPFGPRLTMVTETEVSEDGRDMLQFLPMPCRHCADAPCIKSCPTGALYKREDGIVLVNRKKCIGCHECLWSCPFGAPQYGNDGKMVKCSLCAARLDLGMKPACAKNCPAEAILAGTTEEISKVLRERYGEAAFCSAAGDPQGLSGGRKSAK